VDVIEQGAARGYELEESSLQGSLVWAWRPGDDTRHGFLTERAALASTDEAPTDLVFAR
jgi:hypothetical protein